jgi:DNA-binding NtrC family response regulator
MQPPRFLGTHPIVHAIVGAAERLGRGGGAVAVVGERGTGKELFARYLHSTARRPADAFVRIDCAEPSEPRLRQDLFERDGGWRRARGGTLFLDNFPSLGLEWQERLHDELADTPRAHWPQVIASMDRDLLRCRSGAGVHEDLVELLAPVEVALPALRQRRADIPVLVQHFLRVYAARHGVRVPAIATEALVELWQYDWPGNVRELESVVERVVVLCAGDVIRRSDLPPHIRDGSGLAHRGNAVLPPVFDHLVQRPTL